MRQLLTSAISLFLIMLHQTVVKNPGESRKFRVLSASLYCLLFIGVALLIFLAFIGSGHILGILGSGILLIASIVYYRRTLRMIHNTSLKAVPNPKFMKNLPHFLLFVLCLNSGSLLTDWLNLTLANGMIFWMAELGTTVSMLFLYYVVIVR